MRSCLSKLKVTPSFCFPFKIPDDSTATTNYIKKYRVISSESVYLGMFLCTDSWQLWLDLFKYFAFQVKSMVKGMTIGVNEDTLGAILKASIAQFISLEITKSNSTATFGRGDASRESRSVNRYLPWLSSPPANTAAQGSIPFRILLQIFFSLNWF